MRKGWLFLLPAMLTIAWSTPLLAQEGRPPLSAEDLKALYKQAALIVQFQAEAVQANPSVAPRLAWEVRGRLVEVAKGRLLPGSLSLHVDSIVRTFDLARDEIPGKQFVAAIKPLSDAVERRFQLVGQFAFAAEGPEADALRQLAESDMTAGTGGDGLELAVRPIGPTGKVFPVQGAKTIEIRLTNNGKDTSTYLQAPISEKGGRLYLTGQGMLRIRDTTGRVIADKGTVMLGMVPPPPPKPALILPNASFVETVDLAEYFVLPEGRYTLVLLLATPDGRGRVPSNGFSFQVGAVNLPEPGPEEVEPVKVTEPPPEKAGPRPVSVGSTAPDPAKPPDRKVPDPAQYKPGKASSGLAGLLRPAKASYGLGEPVELEFRLINVGARTVAVDARLERTLTVTVVPVDNSPQPLMIRQVIPWPGDDSAMPEQRAYLREGAFWGRTLNLNTLYGKALDALTAPTFEEISAGKGLTYERLGRNLFGFPKPGCYNIKATYAVARPKSPTAEPLPKDWWIGDVETNTVTIEVGAANQGEVRRPGRASARKAEAETR